MNRERSNTRLSLLALMLWPGLIACGGADTPPDPGAEVIARVGKRPVTRKDFDGFLGATLGGPAEVSAADAELKSRLLDQYLDDELLVAAAVDAGLKISDEEIRGIQPSSKAPIEESYRRILLTRKYKQQVILSGVAVSQDEVRAYFDQHLNEYRQPARVVFRQILIDNPAEAKKIRAQLLKSPEKFEEIAETRSLAPDSGKPYPLEEALLPDTIRKALEGLQQGELSEVVEDPQGYFVLRLEERQAEEAPSFEGARQSIELKLLQDLGQQRYGEFVAGLRGRTKVKIDEGRLGFSYMKKDHS